MAEPTLAEQLKSVSRMATNLQVSINSMCDIIEGQAKEIERLTGLVPTPESKESETAK